MGQTVVTWVLRKYRGVRKILEKLRRGLIGEVGAKPLAVSRGALPEGGFIVLRLANPRIETRVEKRDGIKRILDEQNKFVL